MAILFFPPCAFVLVTPNSMDATSSTTGFLCSKIFIFKVWISIYSGYANLLLGLTYPQIFILVQFWILHKGCNKGCDAFP